VYRLRDGDPEYLLIKCGATEEHVPGSPGLPGGTVETEPSDTPEAARSARA